MRLERELAGDDLGTADDVHLGAELRELVVRQDVAAVEEEGGLGHGFVDAAVVVRLELIPLGHGGDGVRVLGGLVRVLVERQQLMQLRVRGGAHALVLELVQQVLLLDLGVVDGHARALVQQVLDDGGRGRLAHVARVLLEGEAEDADLLVGDRVEHAADHGRGEARLLVLVHGHDAAPVLGDLGQVEALGEVHEVQNVLLEARAAEADRAVEELGADAVVGAHGARDLVHVGARGLADGRDGVDARDALREEGVGDELRQLRGPDVGGDDALARHPVLIHAHELLDGRMARFRLGSSDQNPAGLLQVLDGRSLGQELRVGEHLELQALGIRAQHGLDGLGRAHGHGGLLDDDLVGGGDLCDLARAGLAVLGVGGAAGADAALLGGRVDAHEDDVGLVDVLVQIRREEEVLAPARVHELLEPGLVDGNLVRVVPLGDLRLGNVHHDHFDVVAVVGDHGHRGPAHVPGAHAAHRHLELAHGWLGAGSIETLGAWSLRLGAWSLAWTWLPRGFLSCEARVWESGGGGTCGYHYSNF